MRCGAMWCVCESVFECGIVNCGNLVVSIDVERFSLRIGETQLTIQQP